MNYSIAKPDGIRCIFFFQSSTSSSFRFGNDISLSNTHRLIVSHFILLLPKSIGGSEVPDLRKLLALVNLHFQIF